MAEDGPVSTAHADRIYSRRNAPLNAYFVCIIVPVALEASPCKPSAVAQASNTHLCETIGSKQTASNGHDDRLCDAHEQPMARKRQRTTESASCLHVMISATDWNPAWCFCSWFSFWFLSVGKTLFSRAFPCGFCPSFLSPAPVRIMVCSGQFLLSSSHPPICLLSCSWSCLQNAAVWRGGVQSGSQPLSAASKTSALSPGPTLCMYDGWQAFPLLIHVGRSLNDRL